MNNHLYWHFQHCTIVISSIIITVVLSFYTSLDCMSYTQDITPPFIMIVVLPYTDVVLTYNLMGVIFHHYRSARLRCSRLSPYFSIPINILQQFNINTVIVKLLWAFNFRREVHILLADCRFLLELPLHGVIPHKELTAWSSGCSQFWVIARIQDTIFEDCIYRAGFRLAMVSNWNSGSREILPLFHKDSMYF